MCVCGFTLCLEQANVCLLTSLTAAASGTKDDPFTLETGQTSLGWLPHCCRAMCGRLCLCVCVSRVQYDYGLIYSHQLECGALRTVAAVGCVLGPLSLTHDIITSKEQWSLMALCGAFIVVL